MIIGGYDCETTGLFEPGHRIIEVCLNTYEFDPGTGCGAKIDSYVQRIQPNRSIDAKAKQVHGIHESDLVGKPAWEDVGPELKRRMDRCRAVVAHNGLSFDFPFLIAELERIKVDLPDFDPFDTMTEGRWSTPFGKAPNLQELCWACGVPYNPALAHAAEYDVDQMMACFFFGVRRNLFNLSTR